MDMVDKVDMDWVKKWLSEKVGLVKKWAVWKSGPSEKVGRVK